MDDEADWVKLVVGLLRGLHEDSVIAKAEAGLAATADFTSVPMPETSHPALSHAAEFVAQWREHSVRIAAVRSAPAFVMAREDIYPTAEAPPVLTLTRRRRAAAAPFVGDPLTQDARYEWAVYGDDHGRYIANAAELVWG